MSVDMSGVQPNPHGGVTPRADSAPSHRPLPDPARAASAMAAIVHELSSLLDGSMRQVGLIERHLEQTLGDAGRHQDLERRLRTLRAALVHMARTIAAAGRGENPVSRTGRSAGRAPGLGFMTLADAVRDAAFILEPGASEHGVRLTAEVDPALQKRPAGPMYTVVVNAIRNAVESVLAARAAGRPSAGSVHVAARCPASDGGGRILIEITDDGLGLPPDMNPEDLFRPGVSTKPYHLGIGLALCREAVEEVGGSIRLVPAPAGVGATLRVSYPVPPLGFSSADGTTSSPPKS
jgi:signal transduction histidine kinase